MRFPLIAVLVSTCICLFGAVAGAGGADVAVSAAFSTPSTGAIVSGTVPVVATASAPAGISIVQLIVDGTVVGSDSAAPYTWSWVSSTVPNGINYLQLRAYDSNGTLGSSDTILVTVANGSPAPGDTQGPTVSLTIPGAGAAVSGTASVIAAASDNVGVSNVQLLVDGDVAGSDSTFPYTWAWNTTSLPDGTHTLQARAYDAAGNFGSSSTITVTVANGSPAPGPGDTQAPTVSLTTPAAGATVTGTVSVAAAASDNVGVSTVQLLVDGAVAGSDSASPYTWGWNTTSLPDGIHTLQARAYDAAGNLGTSSTITVTVSNAASRSGGPAAALTGTHWADIADYPRLKSIGYGFAVTNVAPGDIAGAKAKLDAAHNAGIRLIIGLYAFGGPQPYTLNADGTWTFSQGAIDVIKYFATRQSDILAYFGFNEPYWTGPDGATNKCGYYSAAQLRQFRTQVQAIWPGAKIYQDLGWPSDWAPGGDFYNAYPCIGNKYADATGVADYVGVYDYPFQTTGYEKTQALARLSKETSYVINSMHASPVWLGQAFALPSDGEVFPTQAQLLDWNCSVRQALPAGALISWYVWREPGIYPDTLANHPEDWADTAAAACS